MGSLSDIKRTMFSKEAMPPMDAYSTDTAPPRRLPGGGSPVLAGTAGVLGLTGGAMLLGSRNLEARTQTAAARALATPKVARSLPATAGVRRYAAAAGHKERLLRSRGGALAAAGGGLAAYAAYAGYKNKKSGYER